MNDSAENLLRYVIEHPLSSSKEIYDGLGGSVGYATVKRILNNLSTEQLISTQGKGKATRYLMSASYELLYPIDLNDYFKKEQDERQIKNSFNFILINGILS